jgi:hypothetical protein
LGATAGGYRGSDSIDTGALGLRVGIGQTAPDSCWLFAKTLDYAAPVIPK